MTPTDTPTANPIDHMRMMKAKPKPNTDKIESGLIPYSSKSNVDDCIIALYSAFDVAMCTH